MPRPAKIVDITTRTARRKLPPRKEPYWSPVHTGLSLGAYKQSADGAAWAWWSRRRLAGKYDIASMGVVADDLADADGAKVLSYAQAVRRLLKPRVGKTTVTIDDAMEAYIANLALDDRAPSAARDARYRCQAFIHPMLGHLKLSEATAEHFKHWRDHLAKRPPRLRTKPGESQRHGPSVRDDPEAQRKRKNSVNRIVTLLKAALNVAFANGDVDSDKAWRRLKPFRGVDKARVRYLTHDEVARLDAALDPAFRPIFQAALHTGARYGQLCAAVVSDFDEDAGTLRLSTRKGDGAVKTYHVHLTPKGVAFFAALCRGRNDLDAPILLRVDGEAWGTSEQNRRMREASARAGIKPAVTFHATRHTFASHAVMNGTPLIVVARNLGHTDTRMVEKHYGHLAPSYQAEAIRKGAPDFQLALAPDAANVVALRP